MNTRKFYNKKKIIHLKQDRNFNIAMTVGLKHLKDLLIIIKIISIGKTLPKTLAINIHPM